MFYNLFYNHVFKNLFKLLKTILFICIEFVYENQIIGLKQGYIINIYIIEIRIALFRYIKGNFLKLMRFIQLLIND